MSPFASIEAGWAFLQIMNLCFFIAALMVPTFLYSQVHITLSTPIIFSNVTVHDNWSPPTSVNRKKLDGSGFGTGANIVVSWPSGFLIKNPAFRLFAGAGYFKQRFDVNRPFNY